MDVKSNHRSLVMFAVCLCAAYLLPYHVHPFMAFYNDWLVILGVAIVLVFHAEEKKVAFQIPWIAAIPLGLAVIIVAQTLLGMLSVRWDAVLPVAYFILAALAMVLGAGVAAGWGGSSRLCSALAIAHLVAGLVSVVIALLQLIDAEASLAPFVMEMMSGSKSAIRPYANVAQPNQFALLLFISIASIWWLYQVGRLRAGVAIGLVLISLFGVTMTQSRIGWLIVPVFALLAWMWRGKDNFKPVSGWLIAGLVLIYGALVMIWPVITSTMGVLTYTAAGRVGGGSERLMLLQQALQISLSYPWFGAGWYEFGPQQLAIGSELGISVYALHAHNIGVNFAAELGWPITLLVSGTLVYWYFVCCCRRQISKEVGFAALVLMAVLMHSLVEFPLWYAYVLLPIALLIGMVHQEQFGSRSINLSRVYVIAMFLLMALGLVGVAMDYRRVVVGFRVLGLSAYGIKADEGTTDKPDFTIFPHFYDYFQFAKVKAHKGMTQEEIAFMEQVARRFGYASVLMRMSLIYTLNERAEDAVKAMMTIQRLHNGRYSEAYGVWKKLADTQPEQYTTVFNRLSKPDLKLNK